MRSTFAPGSPSLEPCAITGGLSAQDRSTKWKGEKVEKPLYILRGLLKGKPQRLFPRFRKSTGTGLLGPCSSARRHQTLARRQCLLTRSGSRIRSSWEIRRLLPHILRGPKNGKSKQIESEIFEKRRAAEMLIAEKEPERLSNPTVTEEAAVGTSVDFESPTLPPQLLRR